VADDGCGYQPPSQNPGLGWGLTVIAQLSQEYVITERATAGTEVRMRFPIPPIGSSRVDSSEAAEVLDGEAYRALYEYSPDGVVFTVPDGRILSANPAACETLRMTETETEIRALGRHGLADPADDRWQALVAERDRTGQTHGVARMIRGDGEVIEVEVGAGIFTSAGGERRSCTIVRDMTERVAIERELVEMSARLREVAVTDELTGLRNRRGFIGVGSQMLAMADRQMSLAQLGFLDIDSLKALNDRHGHLAGDGALRAVAQALRKVIRDADLAARIGGDEFIVLALGLDEREQARIEQRIRKYLAAPRTIAKVGLKVEFSMGWATRIPGEPSALEDLLREADRAMYRDKTTIKLGVTPANPKPPRR
jgi:diguanylate cyclase (GGDEF)-like protein/PAS domain S-box-containing protein